MSAIAARLERLPFSGFHRRLLLMGGLGYCFDAMDLSIMAFVLPAVMTQWSLSSAEVGVLASSTYIGYLFGAFTAGISCKGTAKRSSTGLPMTKGGTGV